MDDPAALDPDDEAAPLVPIPIPDAPLRIADRPLGLVDALRFAQHYEETSHRLDGLAYARHVALSMPNDPVFNHMRADLTSVLDEQTMTRISSSPLGRITDADRSAAEDALHAFSSQHRALLYASLDWTTSVKLHVYDRMCRVVTAIDAVFDAIFDCNRPSSKTLQSY